MTCCPKADVAAGGWACAGFGDAASAAVATTAVTTALRRARRRDGMVRTCPSEVWTSGHPTSNVRTTEASWTLRSLTRTVQLLGGIAAASWTSPRTQPQISRPQHHLAQVA